MNYIIKTIGHDKLKIMTTIHKYRNPSAMIKENKELIVKGDIEIFGVFDKNKLIGCIHVKYNAEDERFAKKDVRVYLFGYLITQKYQGQGIGKYLLEYVLQLLSQKGYVEFTIGVETDNIKASHIYRSFGFVTKISTITETYQGDVMKYDLLLKQSGSEQML